MRGDDVPRRASEYPTRAVPSGSTFVRELEEDLKRRDFTVNAIAWDPRERIVEAIPSAGAPNRESRLIRAVGNARERIAEDGLRAHPGRALRGDPRVHVEPGDVRGALHGRAVAVDQIAAERDPDELTKMLRRPRARPAASKSCARRDCSTSGPSGSWRRASRCRRTATTRTTCYYHTLHTVDAAPVEKPVVRLAALFHDVGKPATRAGEGERRRHLLQPRGRGRETGRGGVDPPSVRQRTRIDQVAHLVRQHMFDYRPEWTDAAVRRFVQSVGVEHMADLFDLRIADNVGNGLKTGFPHYLEELRSADRGGARGGRQALTLRDLDVNGEDVMRELGLAPGPRVGEILSWLLEEVLEDPALNERRATCCGGLGRPFRLTDTAAGPRLIGPSSRNLPATREPIGRDETEPTVRPVEEPDPRDYPRARSRTPFERFQERLDEAFACDVDSSAPSARILHRAYGKRFRPTLVLLPSKAFGRVTDESLLGAVVVELIHTATLIHDDSVDKSLLRRRLPTVNSAWNNDVAILWAITSTRRRSRSWCEADVRARWICWPRRPTG